jgi:hypothetical protein
MRFLGTDSLPLNDVEHAYMATNLGAWLYDHRTVFIYNCEPEDSPPLMVEKSEMMREAAIKLFERGHDYIMALRTAEDLKAHYSDWSKSDKRALVDETITRLKSYKP